VIAAQALKFPLLSPYLQSVGSDFRHGVNFAACGATAENITLIVPNPNPTFRYFKERTIEEWNISRHGKVQDFLG